MFNFYLIKWNFCHFFQLLSSMMQQKGRDDQGILGFLSADIEKEIRRGKRLVSVFFFNLNFIATEILTLMFCLYLNISPVN